MLDKKHCLFKNFPSSEEFKESTERLLRDLPKDIPPHHDPTVKSAWREVQESLKGDKDD